MTAEQELGVVLGKRFALERLVARGGMDSVYRAFDRREGRPVALKLLGTSPDTPGIPGHLDRFAREIDLLATIRHPRIVQYIAHGETPDGRPYLVMQWLEGEDLDATLRRRRLSLREAIRVLEGVAEALTAVHARGVVHCDLKPSNIFLRGASIADVVLLDFGVARLVDPSRRLTGVEVLLGAAYTMAPERAACSEDIRPAADIFSLGCIAYECLTGRTPFQAAHLAGVLARILFDAPEPVETLCPSIPAPWSDLLGRMLSKDPERRPIDAAALLGEIARLPPVDDATLDAAPPAAAEPYSQETSAEQVLVCVVLASFPRVEPDPADPAGALLLSDPLERLHEARTALGRFGASVEVLADGSLIAVVSSSGAATDQARIAARGALYLRELWPSARIALTTGRALLRQTTHIGEAVDRAAHLLARGQGRADDDDDPGIWIDRVTAGLLDARFILEWRGDSVALRGERPDADESRLLLGKPTPCVGRAIELAQLEGLMARVIDDNAAQAALILAPPGAGKSRLRQELGRRLCATYPHAESLIGYGDPLTAGSPYGLVSDALRRHAGIRVGDDPVRARATFVERLCRHIAPEHKKRVGEFLGELCGIAFPADDSPPLLAARSDPRLMSEQITHAFLDWIAAEGAMHPVILILEDLQWGDGLTVKLIEGALRERQETALLVIALGRPEVKMTFPGLLSKRVLEIGLRPLSRGASERLVKGALGESIGQETLARIVELSSGNALFLEELIRAAAEGKDGDVPETVLAMLQARLSRLAPNARRALRAASILGQVFWLGGVRRLCEQWGAAEDVTFWIGRLVEAEVVERRWQSRFPDEPEYHFHHALVRDAAYGLLTEADRQAGHLAAGRWLEAMGEADAMVLAGHAEEGGDRARAIAFSMSAAEQSFAQNDFAEALARASKGVACGAAGQALGCLKSIQSMAAYALGDWSRACEVGLSALDLLPRGSLWWCRVAEKLMHALPQIDQAARSDELFEEVLQTEPAPEARSAYVYALASLIGGYAVLGAREKVEKCVEIAGRAGGAIFAQDAYARGVMGFWHGWAMYLLEADPYRLLSLLGESGRAFEEAQVVSLLAMARAFEGAARLELGDEVGAEEATRGALSMAEGLGDSLPFLHVKLYRAFVLVEVATPAGLDEAERLARDVLDRQMIVRIEASCRWVLASAALARGEWERAEAEARRVCAFYRSPTPRSISASACLLPALVGQGRAEEAAALARATLSSIRGVGCLGYAEVPFHVAAAEALFSAGEREEAEAVLRDALAQIGLRASRIPDVSVRERYLHRNKSNQRAFELARAWLEFEQEELNRRGAEDTEE